MTVPVTLGKPVVTRTLNWLSMVTESWGDQWSARDIAYEFSGGEKKQSTDTTNRGFYKGGAK
jgi:hypothetical protein